MQVENYSCRKDMPDECDRCSSSVQLVRFEHYGPGYQVDWLCPYCAASIHDDEYTTENMARMFNELEQRLLKELKK